MAFSFPEPFSEVLVVIFTSCTIIRSCEELCSDVWFVVVLCCCRHPSRFVVSICRGGSLQSRWRKAASRNKENIWSIKIAHFIHNRLPQQPSQPSKTMPAALLPIQNRHRCLLHQADLLRRTPIDLTQVASCLYDLQLSGEVL